jgi:hypothetical protein
MKINKIIFLEKSRKIKNQLGFGIYQYNENGIVFYVKCRNIERIYHYLDIFPYVYCVVRIKLKKYKKKISKNITETSIRIFVKHFEYYKR